MEAALRGAVDDVNGLGKGLAVTLREVQFEKRGDEKIPIHGGPGDPEGDFNAINVPWVPGEGYPNVPHGSSFVMAAHLDGSKCPDLRTILTYSQSTEPGLAVLRRPDADVLAQGVGDPGFCEREILADRDLTIQRFGTVRCTSRRAITYRLPLRKRERIKRVRATVNGKRVKIRRVGRRGVRVSLRGRPKARYRIRVTAKTSRKRTIKLDRRARTCAPRRRAGAGEARAAAGRRRCWRSRAAPASAQFDPAYEASNFSKTNERAAIHSTPEYKALLAQVSAANSTEAAQIAAADPERSFVGQTLCWSYGEGCAGDARLYDWVPKDYGQVRPVVFTARNGATLSGRVWFTRAGPAKRPGVVIVNGSVQASETLYWFAAQTLAKAGYVVLTFDPQNQGRSDSRGEAPDEDEGFPAQSDGRPFFDGAQDALDFFLSTPVGALPAAAELQLGHVARAQAGAPRGGRAGTRASTRCGS